MSRKRFAVLGLGEFGRALATELAEMGCEVLAVDSDPRLVEDMRDRVAAAAVADIRDKEALAELFSSPFDVAVIAIGNALEASILATLHLKDLPVKEVWAEAGTEERAEVLRRVGAARVFSPEAEMGRRVATHLANPNMLDYMPLEEGYSIIEAAAPAWTHGRTLADLALRTKAGVSVIAVRSAGKLEVVPGGGTTIRSGDRMVLVGRDEDLERFTKKS